MFEKSMKLLQNKCFIKESMCQDLTLRPYCGRIEYENAFYTYQGSEGICYYCDKNSQILKEEREEREKARQEKAASIQKADPKICPECGNRLVERNGSRGLFIGCTGFPRCRYTRSRW